MVEVGRSNGKRLATQHLSVFWINLKSSFVFDSKFLVRRGGRVVEGARLESVWT